VETPIRLKGPPAVQIARLDDRLTFLYLEKCSIHQDDNGTVATIGGKQVRDAYLPTATMAALLLGPGTSITQPAIAALAKSGCCICFVGDGAVRAYGAIAPPFGSTALLERQAKVVSDPVERIAAARRMYQIRFGAIFATQAENATTLAGLQGFEGVRVKAVYANCARSARLTKWRRNSGTDPAMGPPDAVNIALNHANAALYGVVSAALQILGLSTGLGVIHTGNKSSFVMDIADLYKSDVTIPASFKCRAELDPGRAVLAKMRDNAVLLKLLPRIVDDVAYVLGVPGALRQGAEWDTDIVALWNPEDES